MAYIKSHPNQNYLIPPKLTDLFSKDHICYFIADLVDNMDYSEFDKRYAGAGHPAYHPRILLKILTMGSVDSVRSSRRLARCASENVVYIHLAEKTQPDFRTISDFRKNNHDLVKNLSQELNNMALEHGMIDLKHLSMDGTTIKANANNRRVLDKKTLKKVERYIDRWMEESIRIDEEEDRLYGDRQGIGQMPEELTDKEKRNSLLRKLVKKINKSMKKPEDLKKIKTEIQGRIKKCETQGTTKLSLTDPESRFMLNKKGNFELSYNAQLVVDHTHGLIIADDLCQDVVDNNQLKPNIERVENAFGKLKEGIHITADAGYRNGPVVQELVEDRKFDLLIPGYGLVDEDLSNDKWNRVNFKYELKKDVYTCPEGKELTFRGTTFNKQYQVETKLYKAKLCSKCPSKFLCTKGGRGKLIHAFPWEPAIQKINERIRSEEGKARYKLRKQTVERSFGDIKHNKKFRTFLLRGIKNARTELKLQSIAHNLVIIHNLMKRGLPKMAGATPVGCY